MMVSADGMFERPDHDISWHMVDDEMNQFAIELMNIFSLWFRPFWVLEPHYLKTSKKNISSN
jgi:hypothetical protein